MRALIVIMHKNNHWVQSAWEGRREGEGEKGIEREGDEYRGRRRRGRGRGTVGGRDGYRAG